jgi:hypothetical protein
LNTAFIWGTVTALKRGNYWQALPLVVCFHLGISGAAIWHASDIAHSGPFSWLAADSTNVLLQRYALNADALVLATGVRAAVLLQKRFSLIPAILFYVLFTATGNTLSSKRVYHILD